MMELQGAVGIAQLKKLSKVVEAQRRNRDNLWQAICDLPGIEPRSKPEGSYDTADSLVFLVRDNLTALHCRQELLTAGLSTKILPEAYTWHFAGAWKHMPELVAAHGGNLANAFPQSHAILSRAVSIPVGVNMDLDLPSHFRYAIEKALNL
jgi:8-amino-3,8-dideoxy-alpha-D-manno-octulosonate transaminase